jgi:hypothetical protein
MSILVTILALTTAAGIMALIWYVKLLEKRHAIKVERGLLFVGNAHLAISNISQIEIAPLYDVPPADDLWIVTDTNGNKLSFFNRDLGASAALASLEKELPSLQPIQALEKARDESMLEQPVVVWTRPIQLAF